MMTFLSIVISAILTNAFACEGQPFTQADALTFFKPGQTRADWVQFSKQIRTRQCNTLTGCAPWNEFQTSNKTSLAFATKGTYLAVEILGNDGYWMNIGKLQNLSAEKLASGIVSTTKYMNYNWNSSTVTTEKYFSGVIAKNCLAVEGLAISVVNPETGAYNEEHFVVEASY